MSINRQLIGFFCLLSFQHLFADLVFSDPTYSTEWDSITVYFDATEGDQGLMGYTGDVWAHTGVITVNSSHPGDWKYVKTNWGQNTSDTQLNLVSNNLWKMVIAFPHDYYGVPSSEQILQLAFVFRSHNGSTTGRDIGGADIFLNLYEPGLTAIFLNPEVNNTFGDLRREPIFSFPDEYVPVVVSSVPIGTAASSLRLFLDDSLFGESFLDTFSTTLDLQTMLPGMHKITAVAIDTSGLTDSTGFYLMVHEYPLVNQRPSGIDDGINYNPEGTVALSLFAPHKDFVYVIGDFNDWKINEDYYMHKDFGSVDSVHYWITLDSLSSGEEYAFQYVVDGDIRIADPYADKVLDKWNDQNISSDTYPNLKPYPYGKTDHIVSVLQTHQTSFPWQFSSQFSKPKKEELIIYELLVRDFLSRSDFETLIDTLDYLESLGINAVELMPFNEFEGNSSWGYNASFYFAPDKYYGPKEELKLFIDECHRRGIAVIMDIVLNHTYNQSPFVRLYNEGVWGTPTIENPWHNTESNFSNPDAHWGNDLNHESVHTQNLVDRVNRYWIEEYKIDGFRFDFTKGFGNNIKGSNDPWGSNYDADRIRLLKRMANKIWEFDSTVYVILEHLAENSEEQVLADYGMLLWGNSNYNYAEASMGYHTNGKSDFSWGYFGTRGWENPHLVTYFESHDEERLMYKNMSWGNSSGNYNIKETPVALNRMKAVGTFFFTIPGPKMVWQFSELGYDVSIDDPCRVCEKPILWNYFEDSYRKNLYKTYQALITLRREFPVFHSGETNVELFLGSSSGKKRIRLSHGEMSSIIIGNFAVTNQSIDPFFHHSGMWYDYFSGDSIDVQNVNDLIDLLPGEFHIYTDSFIEPPEQGILLNVDYSNTIPDKFVLYSNHPNPFNPLTIIRFRIAQTNRTQLQVFDILGRAVESLIDDDFLPGEYSITWDGSKYPSGLYFVLLTSGQKTSSSKMILLK